MDIPVARDASDRQPFAEVADALERAGRNDELIKLYEGRAREVPERAEGARLLARAGSCARERLRDLPRAEALYRRALLLSPGSREALLGLKGIYEQRQEPLALADCLEQLGASQSGEEAASLYTLAAELWEQRLGRRDRAALCYQLATRAHPGAKAAYVRARKLFLAEERFLPVFESLERERRALGNGSELVGEYLGLAEKLLDDPSEHGLAARVVAAAEEGAPGDERVAAARASLMGYEASWRERARTLKNASLEERDRRTAARLSLIVARLHAFYEPEARGKVKEALDRCFLLWPAMPGALALLERQARGNSDLETCVAHVEQMAGEAKEKASQAELWTRAGTLRLARLGDVQGALDDFHKATRCDAGRGDVSSLAAELLIETGRTSEALETLERHLATVRDRTTQVALNLRLAELAAAMPDAAGRERGYLETALKLDPVNASAAFRLASSLISAGQATGLPALLELATFAPRPQPARQRLYEEAIAVLEATAPEKAIEGLGQWLVLEPYRPGLLERLIAVGERTEGARAQVGSWLRRAAELAPGPSALPLWRALARWLTNPGEELSVEAAAAWREVLRLDPEDAPAQQALNAMREPMPAADSKANLEARARELEAASDVPGQIAVCEELLALEPADETTLRRLGTLYASAGRWDDVANITTRLLERAKGEDERREWALRLAQLYAERLGKKEEAAQAYLTLWGELERAGVAQAASATALSVIGGLERLASQGVRPAEIARALATHYARSGDHQRQVAALLVQLSSAHDPATQKELLGLLAELHEKQLMDSRAAMEFRQRGLTLDPGDARSLSEAVRLARELRAQAELSRFLRELGESRAEAAGLLPVAAELAEESGAVDAAAAALSAALAKSPGNPLLLGRLVRLYWKARRFADCDTALRQLLPVAPEPERAKLWQQLADANAELNRPVEAAGALQEAIRAGADEAAILPRLCQLLEQGGKQAELGAALGRLISLTEAQLAKSDSPEGAWEKAAANDRLSRLKLKRAQLLEASMGDKSEAVKRYEEVLRGKPTDPDALAALEHLLSDPSCRGQAARALIPALEAIKDHRKLAGALNALAEASSDPTEKVQALKQAAYVHTHHLRQPSQAFAALARALRWSPQDASLRAAARKMAEDADALDSYAEVLSELMESQAGQPADPTLALVLHLELAELFERKLNHRQKALEHLAAVVAVQPENEEAWKALVRLYRAAGDWSALASALERQGALASEPNERLAALREAATLYEQKLSERERAAACWTQISSRDALDREASAALERLYTELDRPKELAFALELRRNQEGRSPQGRELTFRLARLKKERLGDALGALQLYATILEAEPGHDGTRATLIEWVRSNEPESAAAMELLEPALKAVADHRTRVSLREARLAGAPMAERARLGAEIREILEKDLGQPEAAFMSALKSFAQGVERAALQPELERLAKETDAFDELAEIYEAAAAELAEGSPEIVGYLRRAAELREQLGETDDAARVWKELLEVAPNDRQALDSLGKLYEKSSNARSLSEVYERKAQLASEPAERLALLLKTGESFEAAGEDEKAVEAFKSALVIKKSLEGLAALDRLYAKLKRLAEQADILDQMVELTPDADGQRALSVRRVQLLERSGKPGDVLRGYAGLLERFPKDPMAIQGLERLLEVEQTRAEAAKLLEPIYRSQNDARRLVEVLDARVATSDAGQRSALLAEVATLRESLGEKVQAFSVRRRMFGEAPESKDVRDELERLAADLGAFEELAAVYEEQIERGVSDMVAEDLWRRLAVLYGDRLSRPDLAARAWTEVHRRDPKNLFVLDALARIYRKMSAYKELAEVLRAQAAFEPSASAQVSLLFELATLAEETLGDKGLAAETYQEILERKPDDANAIKALGRILSETERYAELAELISREVKLAEARGAVEEALELLVRLGRLKLARLDDPRGALETFQEVLSRRPSHAGAIGALEEMARSENALRGEAATALEPVFKSGGDHLKLVQMLESRASAEPVPQERAELYRKVAELYFKQMENPEMAFVAATRALREVPDDERSLELCLFLVEAADAADELSTLLNEVASRAADDKARASLYRALARLQVEHQEFVEAVESWRRVLEIFPSDAEALDSFGRLLAKLGKVPELLEVLRRQLTMAEDPARRAALLFQLGSLQAEQMNDASGALATFRRLLELKPNDPQSLERMEKLCEAQGKWPELADVLARRLSLQGANAEPALKLKLAEVRETRLLDRAGALDIYTELLTANPRNEGALARVEEAVARDPQNHMATDVLVRAFRANGDVAKLASALEAHLATSVDIFERKSLLRELAEVRRKQDEPELMYLALFRAFKEDPNDSDLRKALHAAGTAAEAYDELAHALEEALPRVAETSDAAEVCLEIGVLLAGPLAEPERAVLFFEKARELDAAGSWSRALPALERLYDNLDQPKELASVLEELAERLSAPQERAPVLYRLGRILAERLESPEAVGAFEKLLELEPKHLEAARQLAKLYEAAGSHDKLYRVLELERELTTGGEREAVMARMAEVSALGLSNVDHSIQLYRELLEKNPRNEQAFGALEGLLEKGRKFIELKELLEKKLTHTIDPRELVRLNDRLGQVVFRMLDNPEGAVPYFRAALDRDTRHRPALEALREIDEKLGRKDDLIVVLRRLLPLQESAEGVRGVRVRLAEVLAELGRREEALDAGRRALEVEPHVGSEMSRVQAVFLQLKAFGDAVKALELRSQAELAQGDREAAVATLFEVAELWRGPGGKPENAGAALEKILELDPANRKAYEQAVGHYQKANDWRGYATVVEHYLPHLVTDEEKVASMRELARVHEHKLGQKGVAFIQACRALQLAPSESALMEDVERLAEETESYEELSAVFEEVADALPRGPLAGRIYQVLARVRDERLDDSDGAEAALRKILEFDPTNAVALESLAGMFQRRGRYKEYIVALEQKIEAAESLEKRKEYLRELARVFEENLKDPREAAGALSRALELEPDLPTFEALTQLYRRLKDFPAVAQTLLRQRDFLADPESQARVQVEVAQLYERELSDDEAAIEAYRQAVELDPTSRPAIDALERLYTKVDRPADLLAVYQRQLELSNDYREKVKVLFKSASIWEDRYQNLVNADACIEGVLAIDPQNLQAIKTLERLRKAQGRWDELVHVVDRHIQLLKSPTEQAELCVEMGSIFHQNLKQVDRAVAAYHQALQLNPECRPAMHALGTLYERSGNWPFALDMLQREAQAAGAVREAVELYHRMGRIQEEMLLDPNSAKAAYLEALKVDAGYLPAIRALKGLYQADEDWEAYEKALVQEATETEEPESRTKALLEVARFYAERKEDPASAAQWYEEAIRVTPDSLEAARPLADFYVSRENWEGAERMLDIVALKLAERAVSEQDEEVAKELCRQVYRLGYVSEKLGKKDKALKSYEKAYQLDATYLPALEGFGNLLVKAKRYEEALKVYSSILIHHREDLTDLEVVEIYWQLGDIHLALKQLDHAQNHFEKALAIDPQHEASLRAMVALCEAAGKLDKAVEYRQSLIQVLDGDAKVLVCLELGKLARDKLGDAHTAIDAYLTAQKLQPAALEIMDALYVLYRETKQGQKAAEMLRKMLAQPELRKDPARAKRVYFALAEIYRDELKDTETAVEAFNAALDLDYRFIEAFSAIEALLAREQQWRKLDENYARMIQRLPKTEETHAARMTLWRALGDLYRKVLKNYESAMMAYQVVAAGMPDDAKVQETYAELASRMEGKEAEAVEAYRRALPQTSDPGKIASALAELAARRKDYDSAYLAAQVVTGLIGEAGDGEREILAKLAPYAKKKEVAQRVLTDRLWQMHLFHPKVRGPISELMAIVFEQAGHLYKEDFAKYQINPKRHLIDVANAQEYQIHHFRYVAHLLGMDQVALFSPFLVATRERLAKRSNEPAPDPMLGIEICHTHPVSLKIGGKFFSEMGQKEVYYLLGRTLALLRSELALSQYLPAQRLEAVLQAAVSLSVEKFRFTADPRAIDAERRLLEKALPEPARAALARVTREYVRTATPNDLRNYLEGAELSAVRAGMFVAGEIEPVKKMVLGESGAAYRVQTRSKIRDLMVFALSEDLHALRVAVGTHVEVQVRR